MEGVIFVTGAGRLLRNSKGSRGNALKHGLAARVLKQTDPHRLGLLTKTFAENRDDPIVRSAASEAAAARLYLERVWAVRSELMADHGEMVEGGPDIQVIDPAKTVRVLRGLKHYERDATRRWEQALEKLQRAASLSAR
jgi:hypothetical protein